MHVPALLDFLDGLRRNNNRPMVRLEQAGVRHPAAGIRGAGRRSRGAGCRDSIASIGPVDAKKSMFRFYRDMRFSKDKTPYKTHFSAALGDRSKRGQAPGYYFRIDHAGTLLVGGGIYRPHPPILLQHPASHRRAARGARRECCATGGSRRPTAGSRTRTRSRGRRRDSRPDTPHIDAIKNRHFFGMSRGQSSPSARRATSPGDDRRGISAICCRS